MMAFLFIRYQGKLIRMQILITPETAEEQKAAFRDNERFFLIIRCISSVV